jgi:hypothetical protein
MRITTLAALVACSTLPMTVGAQTMDVPDAVKAPAGNKAVMTLKGAGELTYECRTNAAGAMEWTFAGPMATLTDTRTGQAVGKYYGGPTWEAMDGSKVTGKQQAVAPASAGNIPLQLVKAEPAMGKGMMEGVTYIQRVNTKGGVAPADACSAANAGAKKTVPYQADYVFYTM